MLRRHPSTAFGSVHVFPGGVVDAADHDAGARRALSRPRRRRGIVAARASRPAVGPSGSPRCARPSKRRACSWRAPRSGDYVRFDHHPDVEARFDAHRRALHAGERTLLDVLAAEDLTLALPDVHYFAHWITPESEPKRFDTRFFLARAPEGQAYAHDDGELIGSEWVRPADALAPPPRRRLRHDRPHDREPPGRRTLRHLRRAVRARPRGRPRARDGARPVSDADRGPPGRGRSCPGWPAP